MKKLWYAIKAPGGGTYIFPTLQQAIKSWQQNSKTLTAEVEVRQDTNTGYRAAGIIDINL